MKNRFQVGVTNITTGEKVDSVFKNHRPFLINIDNYQLSVQICLLFDRFWPVKFCSHDRAPPNSVISIKHS